MIKLAEPQPKYSGIKQKCAALFTVQELVDTLYDFDKIEVGNESDN